MLAHQRVQLAQHAHLPLAASSRSGAFARVEAGMLSRLVARPASGAARPAVPSTHALQIVEIHRRASAGCLPGGQLRGPLSDDHQSGGSSGSSPPSEARNTGPISNSARRWRQRALRSTTSSTLESRLWRSTSRSVAIGFARRT